MFLILQNIANTLSTIQEQSNPQNTTNESRKPFDADIVLAYIDQSLKTLIGANSNNNNKNHPIQNTAFPYLAPVIFFFFSIPISVGRL